MKYIWRVPVEGANIFVNAKHVSETLNLTITTRGASLNVEYSISTPICNHGKMDILQKLY